MKKLFAARWFSAAAAAFLVSSAVQAADFGGRENYADGSRPYLSGDEDRSGDQEPYDGNRYDDGNAGEPSDQYSHRDRDQGVYDLDDDRGDDDDDFDRGDNDDEDGRDDDRNAYDNRRGSYDDDRYGDRRDGARSNFRSEHSEHRGRCLPGWQVKHRLEAEGWTRFRLAEFGEGVATLRAYRRQTNRPFLLKIDGCDGRTISSRPAGLAHYDRPGRQVYSGFKD